MDAFDAKESLLDIFQKMGFKLYKEEQDNMFFQVNDTTSFYVTSNDLREYSEFSKIKNTFFSKKTIPSICSPSYREHILERIDRRPFFSFMNFNSRRSNFIFGDEEDENTYVEIGRPSKSFHFYYISDKSYQKFFSRRIARKLIMPQGLVSYDDLIGRLHEGYYSAKVFNIGATSVEDALRRSDQIMSDILFQLSCLKDIPLSPATIAPWGERQKSASMFKYDKVAKGTNFDLPKATFNQDVVKYYLLGLSSNDPTLQFLAFYQVLEYYFDLISNQKLFKQISQRIKDPKFIPDDQNLDILVKDILTHKRVTKELEKLTLVLNEYVDADDLVSFIKEYEDFHKTKHYFKKREVFGEEVNVSPNPNEATYGVARTIKAIRNALVHSSDKFEGKYEDGCRHIPFSETTEIVRAEIPLIKFLAQKVIIGTSKPINYSMRNK